MPGSKYDRELRFIDSEVRRLGLALNELRESMPGDPVQATEKAQNVIVIETQIAQLMARRKEIEDSFIAAGMDIPDVGRDLNTNVHLEGGRTFNGAPEQKEAPQIKPEATLEEPSKEIESVTDELMGLEIKMLRADMNDQEEEKQKLSMMASSLRSRRDTLVERVKELHREKEEENKAPVPEPSDIEKRIASLDADNRAIRAQVSDLRTEMADVRDTLRRILQALGADD